MFDFDYITKEDIKEHNLNWLRIPDHPYKILTFGVPEAGKTNALLTFIQHKPAIDKVYLYGKDLKEAKYKCLVNQRENAGLRYLNNSKAFIEYSNDMVDN